MTNDHFIDHLRLLEVWGLELEAMKEKHGTKDGKKAKKPRRITPDALGQGDPRGLGLTDKQSGEDAEVVDVDGNQVVLADPEGNTETLSKTSVTSTKKLR